MDKKAIFSALAVTLCWTACNNAPANKASDSASAQTAASRASCYEKVVGRDTFVLQVLVDDGQAEGVLDYNFYEKDKSTGIISGTVDENILRAEYTFQSEGASSTRNIVFKLMDDQAYEGVADSLDTLGNPIFNANSALLKFDPQPYRKRECR
ncbi:hypothetical protein ACWKWU_11940 [Chitinophaga lutea]